MQLFRKYLKNTIDFIKEYPLASFVTAVSIFCTLFTVFVIYKITGALLNFILLFTE